MVCRLRPGTQVSAKRPDLLQEALFRAQAEDAVYGVGGAVRGGVEVADLEFAEQTDAHHLDAGENKDSGDDEDGAV